MALYQFRGCPRCGGDLYLNQGDWQCLQCGRHLYPPTALPLSLPLPVDSGRPARPNPNSNANSDAAGFWDFWRRQAV